MVPLLQSDTTHTHCYYWTITVGLLQPSNERACEISAVTSV